MIYNCRYMPSGYRFAKFDDYLNPLATYTVSLDGRYCDCPVGHRFNCKHREMLIEFKATCAIDTGRFYNPETCVWLPAVSLEPKERIRRI